VLRLSVVACPAKANSSTLIYPSLSRSQASNLHGSNKVTAFAGKLRLYRSTRELFKKIDSDSKHERFKHFLILFWKRIHFVQRVMFASFKIYLSSKFTIQNRYKLKIVCYGSDI
jgi:hypothetical protein